MNTETNFLQNQGKRSFLSTSGQEMLSDRNERVGGFSQGFRCSSSIWRFMVGHRRGWLEQLVLSLFRLSVDSDDPEETPTG